MEGFFHLSEVQRARPETGLVPKCGACGLYKHCQSPKLAPRGKGRRKVMLVGEFPNKTEDENGVHFLGHNQIIRDAINALENHDIDIDQDVVMTNAIICAPKQGLPGDKEVGYCRPNLLKALRALKPQVVITFGDLALRSVLAPYWNGDFGALDRWVGFRIPLKDFWLCPTWSAFQLAGADNRIKERIFQSHLAAAFNIAKPSSSPAWKWHEQVDVLMESKTIISALRDLDEQGGWMAVDYETNCLKPDYPAEASQKPALASFAVSNGKRTISFPWIGKEIAPHVRQFLRSNRTRKIASNGKFEQRWTMQMLGTRIRNLDWDTMIAAHVIDNRPGICSLKFQLLVQLGLSSYNVNVEPYLGETSHSHFNRVYEIEPQTLCRYGGMDVVGEYWLARRQMKQLGFS